MPLTPESQTLLKEVFAQIDRLKLEDIKQLGEYVVSKGIESSGTRVPLAEEIYSKYGLEKARQVADIGMQDIRFGEGQRQFDINRAMQEQQMMEQKRQFGIETGMKQQAITEEQRRFKEEQKLIQQTLEEQRKEQRQAARDWWKPFLGQALATVATMGLSKLLGLSPKSTNVATQTSTNSTNVVPEGYNSLSLYYNPYNFLTRRW